jgi:hypothetical protein
MRLKAHPSCALRNLGDNGRAKITGQVRPGSRLLQAPLTGRPCVFYSLDVSEWFNGSKTPLLEEASKAIFFVDDSTGKIAIDPVKVEVYLPATLMHGHSSDYLSEHRTLLKRHGFGMLDEYGELRSLTFRETIVAPGHTITALGSVRYESDPTGSASYREQARIRVLGSDAKQPLLLSYAA